MLNTVKQMQTKGIFKLNPYSAIDIDTLIRNATTEKEIIQHLTEIQNYIKQLNDEYTYTYNVTTNKHISDFCDKFQFTMFDMDINSTKLNGSVYTKDIDFNQGGIATFGIISNDSIKFTLQERKFIKLINHYYISLKAMDNKDVEYFYIPLEALKLLYSNGVNHIELRNSIEETCKKLNSKQIYWDMTNTKYYVSKHLDSKGLDTGEAESLVDLTILYLPRLHKTNKKYGYVNSIVGIICKVNNFMKLRYELKHIGNNFPTEALHSKYLDYVIMEKIVYQLNLKSKKSQGKLKTLETQKLPDKAKNEITASLNNQYKKTLVDLTMELYYYDKDIQSSDTYFFKICNEPNSKRRFLEVINSIARVALMLYSSNRNYLLKIYCRNKYINMLTKSKDGKSVEVIDGENIYEQVESICSKQLSKRQVNKFFRAGEIGIYIRL